ncbi:ABC transporter ATP-binding protein [Aurantiacibacter sediminis]|uniref:ABC transporter ATP-binding protein n=1 Tax=Aurantiacibacter sediminis TaxID=2793064 RepID=A0ABS0N5V1_9SPHN|nr:ABC transporter ATP-binding protein [Aurantiacibacter sediminis]MBH5323156.1 ABC transporter ATP-binding protein [Aurantiacibacter sediminis]
MAGKPSGGLRALLGAILSFAGPRLPATIAVVALAAVLEGVGLVLLLPVAETVFSQGSGSEGGLSGNLLSWLSNVGADTPLEQLLVMGSAFLLLIILRALVLMKRDVMMMQLAQGFVDHIRRGFFDRLAHADWPVIKRFRKSQLLNSITTNIGRLAVTMQFLSNGLVLSMMSLAYLVAAFVVSPVLGVALLGMIALGLVFAVIWMRRSHRLGRNLNRASRGVMHETTRFLEGMKAAKAARAEAELAERFAQSIAETRAISVQFVMQQSRLRNAVQVIAACFALIVLLVGFGIVGLSGGELLVMAAIVLRLAPNLVATFGGLQSIAHALPAFESIRALEAELDEAHRPWRSSAPLDNKNAVLPGGLLRLKDCRVEVQDDHGDPVTLVQSDQLEIAPGSLVHIGGPSGAGKSTLVEVIAGLHLPARGDVTWGDVSLNTETRRAWQSQIAFAPQEPFIFDGTVRENLLWPNCEASDELIREKLAEAEADRIVSALPDGLDEELLDGGARLSGGERQRLCLARALLRPARMFILDEATSAMDPQLERRIIGGLRERVGDRIILMVSHSLNAVQYADMRIAVSDGRARVAV